MKKIFILLLFFSTAKAARIDQLNEVFANYSKRFSSGSYVKNSSLAKEFTKVQEGFATQLKIENVLKPILVISNDFDTSLIITLYVLVDEQNSLLGFYHEKSVFADQEERSFLRFRTPAVFEKGVGFIAINGGHALMVKGFYFKPEISATLQFSYLTNLKKKTTSVLNLFLIKKNNSWDFYTEKYQLVRQAEVKTWSSIFPPTGGVESILLK